MQLVTSLKRLLIFIRKQTVGRLPTIWKIWIWQQYSRTPHEEDVYLFSQLEGIKGLVLDIGGNAAVFANSLMCLNKSLSIQSWEPNKGVAIFLRLTKLRHPIRFNYRLRGAGTEHSKKELYIPTHHNREMSPSGSLVLTEFEKDCVRDRLQSESQSEQYSFKKITVDIAPVDQFNLNPVAVKIDVEGYEQQVLTGMLQTLRRCYPLLMIENNNFDQWSDQLQALGYRLFIYHHDSGTLQQIEQYAPALNIFAIHEQTNQQIQSRLAKLIG